MPQNKRHAALYQSTSLDTSKTSAIPVVTRISHHNLDLVPFPCTKFRGWLFLWVYYFFYSDMTLTWLHDWNLIQTASAFFRLSCGNALVIERGCEARRRNDYHCG